MKIPVHDTAFLTAYYRAQKPQLSKDPFAYIWHRPSLLHFIEDFKEKVSPYDSLLHQIRNRLFHDILESTTQNNDHTIILNLGAGFSMYPYTLQNNITTIEVDFPNIISYKKELLISHNDILPDRIVKYVSANITTTNGQQIIKKELSKYQKFKKIVIIEGVFFFLSTSEILNIFKFLNTILQTDDELHTISYSDTLKELDVYKRLYNYFEDVLKESHNTTLAHDFYQTIDGFILRSKTSTYHVAKELELIPVDIKENDVLNEYCYSLSKI